LRKRPGTTLFIHADLGYPGYDSGYDLDILRVPQTKAQRILETTRRGTGGSEGGNGGIVTRYNIDKKLEFVIKAN
jgi:hypothetical protein